NRAPLRCQHRTAPTRTRPIPLPMPTQNAACMPNSGHAAFVARAGSRGRCRDSRGELSVRAVADDEAGREPGTRRAVEGAYLTGVAGSAGLRSGAGVAYRPSESAHQRRFETDAEPLAGHPNERDHDACAIPIVGVVADVQGSARSKYERTTRGEHVTHAQVSEHAGQCVVVALSTTEA